MNATRFGVIAWAALVLLQIIWYAWLAPPANGNIELALMLTLPPLILPLLALRRSLKRALLWVGIISLAYFCHGVVAAWSIPAVRLPALIEVALCVVLIGTLGSISRNEKKRASLAN